MTLVFKFLLARTSDRTPFPVLKRVGATASTPETPKLLIIGRAVLIKLSNEPCPCCLGLPPKAGSCPAPNQEPL